MDAQVQYLLTQCSQHMYILKLLRHQGMPLCQLSTVAHSIIVSRILYALPLGVDSFQLSYATKLTHFSRLKRLAYVNHVILFVS